MDYYQADQLIGTLQDILSVLRDIDTSLKLMIKDEQVTIEIPGYPTPKEIVDAINTYGGWSNPALTTSGEDDNGSVKL